MVSIRFKKHILPHLIAVALFIIATIIFYNPIFFEGQQISQHDHIQGRGGAQEMVEYREKAGEEALWTNSMFGGMPTYLISLQWSGDLLYYMEKAMSAGLPSPARITFLMMLSFYIMLLAFKVRPVLAMFGAISFAFSSYNIIGIAAGHGWRMVAIAFMPLTVAGIHLAFRGYRLWGLSLTALALGLEIHAKHPQMTYYLGIMMGLYALILLAYAIKEKKMTGYAKTIGILFIALLLAVGSNFGRLWATYEYSEFTIRGASELTEPGGEQDEEGLDRDYIFQYSNSIFEPLVLLVPNFMGGPNQQDLDPDSNLGEALQRNTGMTDRQLESQLRNMPTYWGKQPLTAPYYAGAIAIFLFVLSMFTLPKKIKLWLVVSIVFFTMLSWGNNFELLNYFMFDHFPLYNKFRSVTFTLIVVIMAINLAGFMGLENWLKNNNAKEKQRQLLISFGIVGGFLLLLVLFAGLGGYRAPVDQQLGDIPQWFINALRKDRGSLLRADAFRSLIFVLIAAGIIYFIYKNKIKTEAGYWLIGLAAALDVATVSARFLGEDNYGKNPLTQYFAPTEADKYMLSDEDEFRVLNLNNPFNEARTSYHFSSVGGYHGAKIQRYQDVISHCLSREINEIITTLRAGRTDFSNTPVLNMLNTRYIYAGAERNMVFTNENAFGNAWLVQNIIPVNGPQEAIDQTCSANTRQSAVVNVDEFELAETAFDTTGSIELTKYTPNRLTYQASLDGPSFAVFSEIYYPKGWIAYIDGEEAEHIRANYVLRAMELPAGEHTIEFVFRPDAYYVGNKIMLAFSGLTLLLFVGLLAFTFIKGTEKKANMALL